MKANRLIFLGGLLIACVLGAAEPELKVLQFPARTIGNGILSVDFLPDADGRIVSLRYSGKELLSPYLARQLAGNPLFSPTLGNARGWTERFWQRPTGNAPLQATKVTTGKNHATLEMPCFGNTQLNVTRSMLIPENSSMLEITSRVTSGLPEDTAAIWLTLFPSPDAELFFPVKRGNDLTMLTPTPQDETLHLAPAAPFVWCRWEGILLALVAEDAELFLSWHARDVEPGAKRTLEIICRKRPLPATWKTRFIVFTALKELRGIAGLRGYNIITSNGRRLLQVEAAADLPKATLLIEGKNIDLPAQKRGTLLEIPM